MTEVDPSVETPLDDSSLTLIEPSVATMTGDAIKPTSTGDRSNAYFSAIADTAIGDVNTL